MAFHVSDRLDQSGYRLLIATAVVIELFVPVYNSNDRHGESFTFNTFGTFASSAKHGIKAGRDDCVKPNASPRE